MSKPPEPDGLDPQKRFALLHEATGQAPAALPSVMKGHSLSWPADRQASVPAVVGEHSPAALAIGRKDSSFLGALAIAINTLPVTASAEELFEQLSDHNKEVISRVDSPKHIAENSRTVRNFKLGFMREIEVKPLVRPLPELDDTGSFTGVIYALNEGSAVVLPVNLRGSSVKRPETKRVVWGAITGYWEEFKEAAGTHEESVTEVNRASVVAHFTLGIALPSLKLRHSMEELSLRHSMHETELEAQLGEGRSARVISYKKEA